ncbi:hypothetical protein CTAYLR_004957 [Chrysophaeum taylorii]|uniref:Rhodanese domain-containing protein n=1 Tax=Chrysophaeum taylorii TaxID=2483200 RepID=A0AAD7XSA9_9STRA|nr:hypothetical protein CTAYLR_004957 [Chrysophaeum taylorii]
MRRLNTTTTKALAVVPAEIAYELVHEVGWESRHQFVDVRSATAFARGRPKAAINVPFSTSDLFEDAAKALERDPPRLVVAGTAASQAAVVLERLGFEAVVMDGGFDRWRDLGLPIDLDGYDDDDDDELQDDGDPAKW